MSRGLWQQAFSDLALLSHKKRKICAANWHKHLDVFVLLKSSAQSSNADAQNSANPLAMAMRLEFLADHLRVLDAKFAGLLQFLGLLATATGLAVGRHSLPELGSPLVMFGVLWVIAIFSCLIGAGWFFWGEMSGPDVIKEAEKHVLGMIKTIVARTSLFRYAWLLTFFAVLASLAITSELV